MAEKIIKTRIQLIRNSTVILEEKNPKTLNGEFYICKVPETNFTKFKIGDGRYFNEISYYEEDLLNSLGIEISDAKDNQILVFNNVTGKWENETFINNDAIKGALDYDTTNGLNIKGFEDATSGYVLAKDSVEGVKWVKPLDPASLNAAVAAATEEAQKAATSEVNASNSAVEATKQAGIAEAINTQTVDWVNGKFWWGSVEEYNALTDVDEGTFYFVRL